MDNTNDNRDFENFAGSAMRLTARMLEALSPETQDRLNAAMHAGSRLVLEFGPMPAFESLRLVLVEQEGSRHAVGRIALNAPTVQ